MNKTGGEWDFIICELDWAGKVWAKGCEVDQVFGWIGVVDLEWILSKGPFGLLKGLRFEFKFNVVEIKLGMSTVPVPYRSRTELVVPIFSRA